MSFGIWIRLLRRGPLPAREPTGAVVPPLGWRVAFSFLAGAACAMLAAAFEDANPALAAAFDQLWAAGVAVREGVNPYDYVGPGRAFDWPWPLYYPFPAVLGVIPLTLLPVVTARVLAVGVSGALLFFALSKYGHGRLLMVLSMPFVHAVYLAHSSLLTTAAALLPAFGFVAILKPNIGLAITIADPSYTRLRSLAVGAGVLLVLSFALQPDWLQTWLRLTSDAQHFTAPVFRPGGFLLLLATLRWRRHDARLLLALSLIPHTPDGYEMLLLFVVTRTALETGLLAVLSWAAWLRVWPAADFLSLTVAYGEAALWLLFMPCLLLVLSRPNVNCTRNGARENWRSIQGLVTGEPISSTRGGSYTHQMGP